MRPSAQLLGVAGVVDRLRLEAFALGIKRLSWSKSQQDLMCGGPRQRVDQDSLATTPLEAMRLRCIAPLLRHDNLDGARRTNTLTTGSVSKILEEETVSE